MDILSKKTLKKENSFEKHKRTNGTNGINKNTKIKSKEYTFKYIYSKKYFKINYDLQKSLEKYGVKTEILKGDNINDIINEAETNNIDAILIEFKYTLNNDFEKLNQVAQAILDYITTHRYNHVIITTPHLCIVPKTEDPNCDLYIAEFSSFISTYLKDNKIKTDYLGRLYKHRKIERDLRKNYDMNRPSGHNQPMRNILRELLTTDQISSYKQTKHKHEKRKTILLDIHSFPVGSFKEKPDTEIVLLQRLSTLAKHKYRVSGTQNLFVLFQSTGSNLKSWNEYTDCGFIDRLREIGEVYIYQDKVNNIWYYDRSNPEHVDFDNDLDINMNDVRVDTHIQKVFKDLREKYPGLENYNIIPIGWSSGAYLALYFSQVFEELMNEASSSNTTKGPERACKMTVLLDPALWTPDNIILRLELLTEDAAGLVYPLTNTKLKSMISEWVSNSGETATTQKNHYRAKDLAYKINNSILYTRSKFIAEHLNLKFTTPVLAFVNIQEPEGDERTLDFNNETRLSEISVLEKHNPKPGQYTPHIILNQNHMIFKNKKACYQIIREIVRQLSN